MNVQKVVDIEFKMEYSNLLEGKKAQSQVIAAVLLILLVLVAGGIIMSFAVPFVKNQLSGTECFDMVGKVEISNNDRYTCYKKGILNESSNITSSDEMRVQIHIGDIEKDLGGFAIELGGASSKAYQIIDEAVEGITMYNGDTTLTLPGKNEERTYIIQIDGEPDSISVYPKLKSGKTCDRSDFLPQIKLCTSK